MIELKRLIFQISTSFGILTLILRDKRIVTVTFKQFEIFCCVLIKKTVIESHKNVAHSYSTGELIKTEQ